MLNQFKLGKIELSVPSLYSQADVVKIKDFLKKIEGVLEVDCYRADKTITVHHNVKARVQEFASQITDLLERKGYNANSVLASSVAPEPTDVTDEANPRRKKSSKQPGKFI
jgi:uncharacterized protein (UPF0297 family)